jgi:hypothetical protein
MVRHILKPTMLTSRLTFSIASGIPDRYGVSAGINFDRFVRACVAVKQLTEAFQKCVLWSILAFTTLIVSSRIDTDRDGWIQVSYEIFMKVSKSARRHAVHVSD